MISSHTCLQGTHQFFFFNITFTYHTLTLYSLEIGENPEEREDESKQKQDELEWDPMTDRTPLTSVSPISSDDNCIEILASGYY